MKCFQVLNDDVLIIDGQKEYHEDKPTFLLEERLPLSRLLVSVLPKL